MIVLDASVLLAFLSRHDRHHGDASALLLEAVDSALLVHSVTMAEVLVGAAKVGREVALLGDLVALGVTLAPPDDEEPLRLARLRATTGLRLPDCCVLDAAQVTASSVATFDRSLATAAGRVGLVVVPSA